MINKLKFNEIIHLELESEHNKGDYSLLYGSAQTHFFLGDPYSKLGKFNEALEAYSKALGKTFFFLNTLKGIYIFHEENIRESMHSSS